MTRKKPEAPPEIRKKDDGRVTEVRHYRLITPLFGGGVTPGEADPVTVVRGTEVRGHLRFWWRATRGGQSNGDLAALKQREDAIWGSMSAEDLPKPEQVLISLKIINCGKPFQATDRYGKNVQNIGDVKSEDSYAAFPLRDKPGAVVLEGVEFELELRYLGKHQADVLAALWAWETFGGIGARTRRGLGALQCIVRNGTSIKAPAVEKLQQEIEQGLKDHVVGGAWPPGVPHLAVPLWFKLTPSSGSSDAIAAWRHVIGELRSFRQMRNKSGNSPFGRSLWPEPDKIRRITGDWKKPTHAPVHPVGKFPRGRFGLPIIFAFKKSDENLGDPAQSTLQSAGTNRYASRLILRPLACANGRGMGLAAILVGPKDPPGGYVLNTSGNVSHAVNVDLNTTEANQIKPLNGQTDVLLAFLDYLK